jgi:hypothetical protein
MLIIDIEIEKLTWIKIMSTINIANLHLARIDLFSDGESFMRELSESEFNIQGGLSSNYLVTKDIIQL